MGLSPSSSGNLFLYGSLGISAYCSSLTGPLRRSEVSARRAACT